MEKKTKNLMYSFIYILCLYIGIQLLPLADWIPIEWLFYLIKVLCFGVVAVLAVFEIKRVPVEIDKPEKRLSPLFLIPLIIGAGSNILYALFFQEALATSFDALEFVGKLVITIICVVIEELLFRVLFLQFMLDIFEDKKYKQEIVILMTAMAFSLMHCVNFYGSAPLAVVAQLGYTFILGLILGAIAFSMETPILPIVAHQLFNILNTNIYVAIFSGSTGVSYYLFNAIVGAIVFAYFGLVYFIYRRKQYAS